MSSEFGNANIGKRQSLRVVVRRDGGGRWWEGGEVGGRARGGGGWGGRAGGGGRGLQVQPHSQWGVGHSAVGLVTHVRGAGGGRGRLVDEAVVAVGAVARGGTAGGGRGSRGGWWVERLSRVASPSAGPIGHRAGSPCDIIPVITIHTQSRHAYPFRRFGSRFGVTFQQHGSRAIAVGWTASSGLVAVQLGAERVARSIVWREVARLHPSAAVEHSPHQEGDSRNSGQYPDDVGSLGTPERVL